MCYKSISHDIIQVAAPDEDFQTTQKGIPKGKKRFIFRKRQGLGDEKYRNLVGTAMTKAHHKQKFDLKLHRISI